MQTANKNYLTAIKTMQGHKQSRTRNASKEISKHSKHKKLRRNTEQHTGQQAPAEEDEAARDEQWKRSNGSKNNSKNDEMTRYLRKYCKISEKRSTKGKSR